MDLTRLYFDIISGRAGLWAAPLRGGLAALERIYIAAEKLHRSKRRADDPADSPLDCPAPVISVGNITVGGTGKTPLVIDLLQRLIRRDRKPGVVARGYRSAPGRLGDELAMISRMLPSVACIANADRRAGCIEAHHAGADVVILDDGFRHRSVARVIDIVVVDATNPFGYGRRLPRGLLRESPESLCRADVLLISRADMVAADSLRQTRDAVRAYAPDATIVSCRHRPIGLSEINGARCADRFGRAVLFAAIGNPDAFAATVRQMNIEPVACLWLRDHHHYRQRDIDRIAAIRKSADHDVVLTTRKDAIKLRALDLSAIEPLRVVDVAIEYLDDGGQIIERKLDALPHSER